MHVRVAAGAALMAALTALAPAGPALAADEAPTPSPRTAPGLFELWETEATPDSAAWAEPWGFGPRQAGLEGAERPGWAGQPGRPGLRPHRRPARPALRRALAQAVSELSGKTPEAIVELFRSGKGPDEVLEELGLTREQVQEKLESMRAEWQAQQEARRQAWRQRVIEALSAITGESPEAIAELWPEGSALRPVLEELEVNPLELRRQLRAMRSDEADGADGE